MSEVWGFVATLATCFAFGSQYVLLKGLNISDGLTFQWLYGSGIIMTGLIANAIAKFPTFYPLPMMAGFLWAIGNIVTVPMFHFLGVAPAFLIWTSVQMVVGWATGRYGWFGIPPEQPASDLLNYLGLGISVVGGLLFFFIRNSRHEAAGEHTRIHPVPDTGNIRTITNGSVDSDSSIPYKDVTDANISAPHALEEFMPWIPKTIRYVVGCIFAIYAGFMYGVMFAPITYLQAQSNKTTSVYYGASVQGIPYAFSMFCGVYATTSVFFIIYCAYKLITRSEIYVTPILIWRTVCSGWIWGFAMICWLYANSAISVSITYPLCTRLPGAIQAIFGVFYFREIRGTKNYIIVVIGTIIVVIGSILTGMSNSVKT